VLSWYSPFQVTFSNVESLTPDITVCPLDLSIVKFSTFTFSGLSLLVKLASPVPLDEINLMLVVSIFSLVPDCVSPLSITLLGISRSVVNRYSPLGTFSTFLYVLSVFLNSSVNAFTNAWLADVLPSGTAP